MLYGTDSDNGYAKIEGKIILDCVDQNEKGFYDKVKLFKFLYFVYL